ncbi:MAG: hypothetical protein KA149_03445 [Chitinophagales bacterium]|nr:hypothetical protein [Chitinophagales bacterium]
MITTTTRPFTDEEIKRQIKQLPSVYKRFEGFVIKLIFIVLALDIPLLVYDHFSPVASQTQAVYCIVMVVVALVLTFWVTKKWEGGLSNDKYISDINAGEAEVVHVTTTRTIKREDPEDFGVAYYVDILDNGQQKTLYLWGQYSCPRGVCRLGDPAPAKRTSFIFHLCPPFTLASLVFYLFIHNFV